MEKEFIPYEQALVLKELGFKEPCIGYWWNNKDFTEPEFLLEYCEHVMDGNLKRPTFSQAFRFFREKYELYPQINLHDRENKETWRTTISILGLYDLAYNQNVSKEPYHKTYEEAELECLVKLIDIVKKQNLKG